MATQILSAVASWIMGVISALGYGGVVLLMAIESANIPLPSEIIMPFSGFLVAKGELLIENYGKYIFISHHDLDLADRWFKKHGEMTVFVGRLLPVIRTFISFPAGIARMNFWRFVIYSFLGSLPWSLALAFLGQKLGENWESLRRYFHGLDWLILGLIIIGIVWWIRRHLKQNQKH
ncbi:MAG: hypothetical protein US31_C0002G0013 [Berkelbacteria bacterium GW2011_GWA1_36_9]|uniref:VTT domain-containing protein n=1 Tax=Berkelbacteria bacterium GW2011_GWA1_36_9 TaxID=1618331 RepID=A0A0G0FI02_9BACT|nr:MAG: hypothetical protein US31_C0002G0013 [Berkelbacteria bacterium GW2011_GWA1_36_9]